jgi:hypothetical protein
MQTRSVCGSDLTFRNHRFDRFRDLACVHQVQHRYRRLPDAIDRVCRLECEFPQGELSAIHAGLGHRARQALADPLLLCDVVFPEHRHASPFLIQPTPECRTMADISCANTLGFGPVKRGT